MTVTHPGELTHLTVLLDEAIEALEIQAERANGIYVDGTFGRGGHSRKLLQQLGPQGRLIAFDKDPYAIANAEQIQDPRFHIVHNSFATMAESLHAIGVTQVDGILMDLGISSPQVDDADALWTTDVWVVRQGTQPEVLYLRGEALRYLGDAAGARASLEEACRASPHDPDIGVALARALTALGLPEEPVETFRRGGVELSAGPDFGSDGHGFVRLNFATSGPMLERIVGRMRDAAQVR